MALTGASAAKTGIYNKLTSVGAARSSVRPDEIGARKRVVRFSHTVVDGDGTTDEIITDDEMNLVVLPPNCVLDLKESYAKLSASQGANTELWIGTRAYTLEDGTLSTEDADQIAILVGSTTTIVDLSTVSQGSPIAGNPAFDNLKCIRFNSRTPIHIFMKAKNATGTFDGDIGDVYDFQFTYYVD